MDEKQKELERTEAKMNEIIEAYANSAREWLRQGMQAQGAFAEKLLLSSGAALGVLSTLFATDVSRIQPGDFTGPVVLFIISMVAAGVGLWSRSIAFFKSSGYSLSQSEHLAYRKARSEEHWLGQSHTSAPAEPPQLIRQPEGWFNVLDYSVGVSGISFVIAVSWIALNFAI